MLGTLHHRNVGVQWAPAPLTSQQICTDLIYQPLSCLDCLHTFCGSCLKEWFTFQAAKIEKEPLPPTPDTVLFTCPSCRAPVRDTRRNATFNTLLEMLLDVHPEKGRSKADKEEMARKYKPGDEVIPKVTVRERTDEERRAEEEDQRLINQVREISLREAEGGAAPLLPPRPRRRTGSRSRSGETEQHRTRESGRPRPEQTARRSSDQLNPESDRRRGRRSESRQRQVEHQSSLRSLISSADVSEQDYDREIEDFARQIQEEGLLDGLDLDNIDLSRDDELSRRITEAYRRRQRERTRQERVRRSNHSGHSGSIRPEDNRSESRNSGRAPRSRSNSRPHANSRSASASRYADDRSRPPPSMSANLDVRDRTRRRTGSGGRSTTAPVPTLASNNDSRPAARSQTDLSFRTQTSDPARPRSNFTEERRSSSTPNVPASNPPAELPANNAGNLQSFANRANQATPTATRESPPSELPTTPPSQTDNGAPIRENRPAELAVLHSAISNPLSGHTQPTTSGGHQRSRSQLYPEPSIACARCRKAHIEYELHYNCHICSDGQWNICLDCYRTGKGCQYWFGFGYGAWTKWEKVRQQKPDGQLPTPHMMTASRYTPPSSTPGGADGRKTLTTDDPRNRLESGTFCARCFVWTNHCYWRCDVCNGGDWGFCNNCVNQGKSCTHALLPLSHEATQSNNGRPVSPRSPGRPPAATIFTGPSASSIGPFKPLTFNTRCDICQDQIPPPEPRYHCFQCTSALIADAVAGDYDICFSCYNNLVAHGEISFENGHSGWRRCLNGHRMAIVGFTEGKIGMWRYVDRDMVGGRALRAEPYDSTDHRGQELQKWSWTQGEQRWERLVTKDVKAMSPTSDGSTTFTKIFPPDGGVGFKATAKFAWHPQAGVDDELLFPRGAEIREIEEVTGEWYHGVYMGAKGLFPSNYVRTEQTPG